MAGLEPVVVFWTGWGIHLMVLLSFTVQVTLLLASDFRRRKGSAGLKVVIWSAYMLADMTAIYALGHMSVVCRSPQHHLMALWAPLLLVHLGGQDNITAYAIEDNRLWLRHLQIFVGQVAAAVYVLYVSSILTHPSSSKLRWAAILMFVVGILKYGERIWTLMRADSYCSSSLSTLSYNKVLASQINEQQARRLSEAVRQTSSSLISPDIKSIVEAYSLLDVSKQMFEGPTSYVQINNEVVNKRPRSPELMFLVVRMQLTMMYDLLYTKAVVVHTWYGLFSRFILLPFTVTALALFRSSLVSDEFYSRVDVTITNVLLSGAVALETMSLLRAIFSRWTAVLLLEKKWYILATVIIFVESSVIRVMELLVRSAVSGRMGQHSLFKLWYHSGYSRGSKMTKRVGLEDLWDSNVNSWSTKVPQLVIQKVLELVSQTTEDITTTSPGLNALRRNMENKEQLVTMIWTGGMQELKLEERILVWHIATHVYTWWHRPHGNDMWLVLSAAEAIANYMFFLLAARPYMLPYPVSRQPYVDLCSDAVTRFNIRRLVSAILNQKEALLKGTPLQPDERIGQVRNNTRTTNGAQPQASMNTTLDKGCQLAAKLIHITEQAETFSINGEVVLKMVLEVWVEMLCYTAYLCNEKSHAKHLTDGGEIMTLITLLMIYMKNGLICENTSRRAGQLSKKKQKGRRDGSVYTDRCCPGWPHV